MLIEGKRKKRKDCIAVLLFTKSEIEGKRLNQAIIEYIKETAGEENVFFQEPMCEHTTFRTGGEAAVFVDVPSEEVLQKLIAYFAKVSQEFFVVGKGSNLLVGDKGYQGVILHVGSKMANVQMEGNQIIAQAGASLPMVALMAAKNGLSGLEFAAGIPGSVGGAIVMNAGAYDGEMKQVVKSVTVLNQLGEEMVLDCDTMEFGYRTSIIKNRPFVVIKVVMELTQGDPEQIKAKGEEFNARRREKQPLEYPSAGSSFKRPEGYFAGKLIMDAGLRGFRIGDAQVSSKHCGFIINAGKATSADVRDVMDETKQRVKECFGVELEPEIVFLGDF